MCQILILFYRNLQFMRFVLPYPSWAGDNFSKQQSQELEFYILLKEKKRREKTKKNT